MKKRGLAFLVVAFLIVGLVSPLNANVAYAAKKKIHVKKKTVSLVIGKTYQQKLIDKKGKTIKPTKVKWKSLKKSVAKITKKGKIKAVKKGTAKMTAKYKGKTYKFTVKVKNNRVDPKKYTSSDKLNLSAYIWQAINSTKNVSDYMTYWAEEDYSSYSSYLYDAKNELKDAYPYLVQAKKITNYKYSRKCTTDKAIDAGYLTWNSMVTSLVNQCNKLKNTDVSSLTEFDRSGYAIEVLKLVRDINICYLEIQ